jgi:hypothetical protein
MKSQFIIWVVVVFVLLSVVFYMMKIYLPDFQFVTLELGNVVMAVLCVATYLIIRKQVDNRPEAFVRGVYSASFLKLMVCMVSILVYVLLNRSHIHKPSVFVLFGIYALYTIIETAVLSGAVKRKQ